MTQYKYQFERRRYGGTTFTWVWVAHRGKLLSLGDPWPSLNPPQAQLEEAARYAISKAEGSAS